MDNPNLLRSFPFPLVKLTELRLNQEAIDNLPQSFKDVLVKGELSPLVAISLRTKDGTVITLPVKLQVVPNRYGENELMVYPVNKEINNSLGFSESELNSLAKGYTLCRNRDTAYQLDPETNMVLVLRKNDLEKRLTDMEKILDIELGTAQKQQVREGKPVVLDVGGEKTVVGLDLRQPQGFRIINGDLNEWETKKKLDYDDLHPEYIGLRKTDKNRWEYQKVVEHGQMSLESTRRAAEQRISSAFKF